MKDANTWKILRDQWWKSLEELADLELQHRWLDTENANPHWSYVELACTYPDAEMIQEAEKEGGVSPEEAKIFLSFGRTLTAYRAPNGDDYGHAEIFCDPAWRKITEAAETALQALGTS